MKNNYKLYLHKCPNGKRYYGITKESIKRRWRGGKGYKTQLFYRPINKYGWDNIEHIVLYDDLAEEDAKILEQYFIQWYDTTNPIYGYNVSLGGDGGGHEGLKGELNPMFGKTGAKNSASKKVIRLDTLEIFESITQASESINGKHRSLCMALSRGLKYKGIAFKYYDDYLETGGTMRELKTGSNHPLCKKVIRLDTLEIFDSVKLAAESIGANKDSLSSTMSKGLKYKGIAFKYYDDYLETGDTMRELIDQRKKVINVDTGEVFDSIRLASESINGNSKSLAKALKRKTKYKGHNFKYYDRSH